jgi:hypothetical protein
MNWTAPSADGCTLTATGFTGNVRPMRDGRWTWEVYREGGRAPAATGVSRSQSDARRTVENFVKRSGGE